MYAVFGKFNYFISLLEFTGVNNVNKNHKKNKKIELLKKYLQFFKRSIFNSFQKQ